jgi:hypothetical protein
MGTASTAVGTAKPLKNSCLQELKPLRKHIHQLRESWNSPSEEQLQYLPEQLKAANYKQHKLQEQLQE